MAVVMYFFSSPIPSPRLIIMIVSIFTFISLTTSDNKYLMTIAILISTGVSYGFSFLASIISASIIQSLLGMINMTLLSILTALASLSGIKAIPDSVTASLIVATILCTLGMILWSRYSITTLYHQKLNENTI